MLDLFQENRRFTIPELAEKFTVSEITIRRDLNQFKQRGLIEKAYGGTIAISVDNDIPIIRRLDENREYKERIAKTAAQLIGNNTSIFVGSGSTTAYLARYLVKRENITVVTNAINLSSELAKGKEITVVVVGGVLRPSELSLIGHITEQSLEEINVSKVFMGMAAISVEAGLTNYYLPEVRTDRKLFDLSSETIILADHTKFGKVASAYVAPIEKITTIITDDETDPKIIEAIRRLGVKVIIADSSEETFESENRNTNY